MVDSEVLAVRGRKLQRLPSGYRPGSRWALVVRLGCLVGVVLAGASLAAFLALHDSLARDVGITAARSRIAALTDVIRIVGVITAVAWVAWLRRMYRNLRALGARWLRLGPGWAVGAWFVPGVNVVAPKMMLDDVWRTAELAAPHPIGIQWRQEVVPWWLHAWWVLAVGTGVAWVTAAIVDHGLEEQGPLVGLAAVAAVALVTLPATSAVVGRLTHRQEARARYLELEQPEPRHHPVRERLVLIAAVATAVVVAGFGLITWPVASADAKAPGPGVSVESHGVVVIVPFRFITTVTPNSDDDSGSIVAANAADDEQIEVGWSTGTPTGDEALFALVDSVIVGLSGSEDDIFYRGRPVALTVEGVPALLENFSISVGSNMVYGAALATSCTASDRTMVLLVVVDSTRPARNAVTQAVIPGLHC